MLQEFLALRTALKRSFRSGRAAALVVTDKIRKASGIDLPFTRLLTNRTFLGDWRYVFKLAVIIKLIKKAKIKMQNYDLKLKIS